VVIFRLLRVADQVMPEGQPFAGLSQNARFDMLDCVLPARTSMFSPEWVSAPGAATWLESAT
jgi:hypothetical protein